MILAGDIGGTKTNLAYFKEENGRVIPVQLKSYPSQQYRSVLEIIDAMQKELPAPITAAAFGVAGPIVEGRSKLTNLDWEVIADKIRDGLKLPHVGLLNDLEATAYGVLNLPESDRLTLQPGEVRKHAAIAVIAAGTGLGEGALIWDGKRYRAMPSEGGHSDFASRNELEMELLRFLLTKFKRVSYERILSGPGFASLYEFFRARSREPEPAWLSEAIKADPSPAAAISRAGLERTDPVCVQVLDLFVSLYGAEAGNLALKVLATGGVYIGGGIAPKILSKIQEGGFLEAFTSKGRHSPLLKSMPLYVILNDKIALYGAAYYAAFVHD
ncbi:glucokinase [bacterium]|nr:MAG: glucokinase [bacterium]